MSLLEAAPAAAPREQLHVRQAGGWSPAVWLLLVALCGALFLDGLDVSMVGVALPSIGADLHLSSGSLQWIVSGYVLGYGGLLLLGGRAADLLGRRRVFLTAVAVFGVASVVSAALSAPFCPSPTFTATAGHSIRRVSSRTSTQPSLRASTARAAGSSAARPASVQAARAAK